MSKTIEEQVEEFLQENYEVSITQASSGRYPTIQRVMINLTRTLQERERIAREEAIKECERKYKNEIGGFIAGAYALRFGESSREVECWDMWKAGYEQCRKDALNAIKYESRRQEPPKAYKLFGKIYLHL